MFWEWDNALNNALLYCNSYGNCKRFVYLLTVTITYSSPPPQKKIKEEKEKVKWKKNSILLSQLLIFLILWETKLLLLFLLIWCVYLFSENLRDVRITDTASRRSGRYSYNFTPSRGGDVTDMSGLKKKLQQIEDEWKIKGPSFIHVVVIFFVTERTTDDKFSSLLLFLIHFCFVFSNQSTLTWKMVAWKLHFMFLGMIESGILAFLFFAPY